MDSDRFDWLTAAERSPIALQADSSLVEAVNDFHRDTDLRLLPVVDAGGRPVGAIFEKDVRRLLLNPFGHALLSNPTIGSNLSGHVRFCPVHDVTDDIRRLIDHYLRSDGREGMMLTKDGKLFATLSNRRLVLLAAEHEQRAHQARIERAQRIEIAASHFESDTAALALQMVQLANVVQQLAAATVDRAAIAGERASSVATATLQTRETMDYLADRGDGLASAFAAIEAELAGARGVADRAVGRVSSGGERARQLLDTTQSIDQVMTLVSDIAETVNLLSLNASIEAARAGEAGLGFAVVANEIKGLSSQTQAAAQEITRKVGALRDGVAAVAGDYDEIERAIGNMADAGVAVDRAVVREAETTRLIATTVGEAREASLAIEDAVRTIVHSVGSASSSARDLDRMANDLRSGAEALGSGVNTLLSELRAA